MTSVIGSVSTAAIDDERLEPLPGHLGAASPALLRDVGLRPPIPGLLLDSLYERSSGQSVEREVSLSSHTKEEDARGGWRPSATTY